MTAPKRKLLILGYARHGKDTVAEILRDEHGFEFASSSMFLAESVIRPLLESEDGITYGSLEECYGDRVNHRARWYDIIKAWNAEDPSRLAKAILERSDIYVGMRSAYEFAEARKLFDEIWWVDASGRGLPPEDKSSMDIVYEPDHMRMIDNSGDLLDLRLNIIDALGTMA